ncbi:MAG: hypothetical protein ACYC6D_01985 [Melioribacteraceae bacterium]
MTKVENEELLTVANFAKKVGIDRKMIYYFIQRDKLDCKVIDGVKFIVLTDRTKNFIKNL